MDFKDITHQITDVAQKYHFGNQPPFLEELLRTLAKVLRGLESFFNSLFHHGVGSLDSKAMSSLLQVLVYGVSLAAIAFLCWFTVTRITSIRKDKNTLVRGAEIVEKLLDAAGWQTQASKLADAQDYQGACRALYLSSLQALHEQQLVPFAPAKTNYEYYASLTRYPEVQKDFRQLAELVETVWFGNQSANQGDYQTSRSCLSQLNSQITQYSQKSSEIDMVGK